MTPEADLTQVKNDIKRITDASIQHNFDDKEAFKLINEKLDKNHDVHIRNEETLKKILEQAMRTNGRVTKIEDFVVDQKVCNAQMADMLRESKEQTTALFNISSKQDGLMILKWKEMEEKMTKANEEIEEKYEKKDDVKTTKGIVYAAVAIILTAVLSGGIYLLFHFGALVANKI
jgi:hypothetical protein